MTHVFNEEMWLCDIAHSIVGSIGGGESSTNSNGQSQTANNFAQNTTGNQVGQYANGAVNAQQLQDALNAGQGIYQNGNALTNAGLSNVNAGANAALGLYGQGNQALSNTLNGSYLSAGGNPYFQNMISQLGQAIQPQIDGQFAAMGRYGSGANANAFASALANQAGQLAYQNYGAERANQVQTANNLPSYTAGLFQPGQAQLTAGYAPINQYIQQLSMLKPGTAGSYGQSSTNATNGTGNSSNIATGNQSTFGVNASSASKK